LASWALGLVAVTLGVRLVLASFSEYICLRGNLARLALGLLPLKDLVAFGLWLSSFLGHEVVWQGRRYRLTREGLLEPLGE